ncbi:MAG: SUMF1/EgtB/PvdO family nonheme iron enzyme [Candidatus Margulisiibacteriota bacterium]
MKTRILSLILLVMMLMGTSAFANNIDVGNVSIVDQDDIGNTYDLQFDISWDNCWYDSGAPSTVANWDAAWVFAKFSTYNVSTLSWSDWKHCTLLNTGYTAPAGSQINFGATSGVYKGTFIYRSSAGSGPVNWDAAEIRWNYGADSVDDSTRVKVQVYAIEMVYIPQGSFYVGDTDNDNTNCFYEGASGTPRTEFQITSEGAITVADTAENLYYDADNGYSGDQSGPVPAAFPKGYNAFYIMKYEISQKQYCDFLNTLTSGQTGDRAQNNYGDTRYYILLASNGKYGCNATGGGTWGVTSYDEMNQADDGGWTACNYLSYMDVAAYADWAALRPFTELEFEKACRGSQAAVDDEYAWGNTTLESFTTTLNSANTNSEAPNQGNMNYSSCTPDGPFRVGCFADGSSTRTIAGASYFGVLDLSGSVWERTVTVGTAAGRVFTGTHGDGELSANGRANNSDWPGFVTSEVSGADGSGFRGGNWIYAATLARVSDRIWGSSIFTARNNSYGGRCARTSP